MSEVGGESIMIVLAATILVLTLIIGVILSNGKWKDKKFIVWGIITMVCIAPLLSWIVSVQYGIKDGDGFAGIALMMVMFPIIFLVGLIILFMGVYRQKYPKYS
ncbi:hypothetical protein [Bacillus alkalisoli]|uniref:hypothetical protein n=1 Tax=Bacillus alkalisoli TaxID=2011008 RepID=UPI0012FE942F|nr:hypothetical protein [Bacillus alkalisoli]